MSELSVGSIGGLSVNNNVISIPSGHKLHEPGHVVQVVTSTSTTTTAIATTSWTQVGGSNLTITITPKFSNSRIILMANVGLYSPNGGNGYIGLFRGGGAVNIGEAGYYQYQAGEFNYGSIVLSDLPNTTSPTIYGVYARGGNTNSWTVNYVDAGGQVRSTLTAFEVAQ
jgi:hypothetical protein